MKKNMLLAALLYWLAFTLAGCGGGGTDSLAPTTPTGVQATVSGENRIDLAWAPAADNASLAGYKVYRDGGHIGSSGITAYSDVGVTQGVTYSYQVSAVDYVGNESEKSQDVTVNTGDTSAPTIPANLQATVVSSSEVRLTWTASTDDVGVSGYRIYRDGSLIGTPMGLNYSDTGLSTASTYSYRVSAFDAAGNASSQTSALTVNTGDTTPPTVPAGVAAAAVSSTRIDLSWTASTDDVAVASYRIYRNSALLATVSGTSYSDTGLAASTATRTTYRLSTGQATRQRRAPMHRPPRPRRPDGPERS